MTGFQRLWPHLISPIDRLDRVMDQVMGQVLAARLRAAAFLENLGTPPSEGIA